MKTKQPANFLSFFRTPVFFVLKLFFVRKRVCYSLSLCPQVASSSSSKETDKERETSKNSSSLLPSPPCAFCRSPPPSLQVEINISHRAGGSGSDSTTKLFSEKKRQQNIAFFFVPFPPFHSRKVPYFLVSLSSGMYVLLCSLVLLPPPVESRMFSTHAVRCKGKKGPRFHESASKGEGGVSRTSIQFA